MGRVSDSLTDVLSTPLNQSVRPERADDPFPDTTDEDDSDDNDNNDEETPWGEMTDDVRERLLPTRQESDLEIMEVLSPSMLRVRSGLFLRAMMALTAAFTGCCRASHWLSLRPARW